MLRHLAFVQPRFESFVVSPRRRYVCLLRAIAMVLATKAGDERLESAVQRRAEAALSAMEKSEDCFVAGLAGDFGEVCLEFLRKYDVTDHDPARTAREVREFNFALKTLFVQGYVLCSEEPDVPVLETRKTLSQIAIENMEEPLLLTFPGKPWPPAGLSATPQSLLLSLCICVKGLVVVCMFSSRSI